MDFIEAIIEVLVYEGKFTQEFAKKMAAQHLIYCGLQFREKLSQKKNMLKN